PRRRLELRRRPAPARAGDRAGRVAPAALLARRPRRREGDPALRRGGGDRRDRLLADGLRAPDRRDDARAGRVAARRRLAPPQPALPRAAALPAPRDGGAAARRRRAPRRLALGGREPRRRRGDRRLPPPRAGRPDRGRGRARALRGGAAGGRGRVRVEIWSDVVCPWCYIGKRRFETALARFEHADAVEVVWRSFELDPDALVRRGPTAEHLARKYGWTPEQVAASHARLTGLAAAEGLEYRLDETQGGNTFPAHQLLHLAAEQG